MSNSSPGIRPFNTHRPHLAPISKLIHDITITKRYGDNGHPCLLPAASDSASSWILRITSCARLFCQAENHINFLLSLSLYIGSSDHHIYVVRAPQYRIWAVVCRIVWFTFIETWHYSCDKQFLGRLLGWKSLYWVYALLAMMRHWCLAPCFSIWFHDVPCVSSNIYI